MTQVYFSFGSNVGDRQEFLDDALSRLKEHVEDITASSVYQTEPWGNENQPKFLNSCLSGQTSLGPEQLLAFTKSIETEVGRKHSEKWGPREIDIDILFYGAQTISLPGLEIPHPSLPERAFVLIPLAEIAPDFIHPVLKESISSLAAKIKLEGIKKLA